MDFSRRKEIEYFLVNQKEFFDRNIIDFEEIRRLSIAYKNREESRLRECNEMNGDEEFDKETYIMNNVFLADTNQYIFQSNFKNIELLISSFDFHSGSVYGNQQRFDINETPTEKVKRLYRKNISDPKLYSWYEYNLALSKKLKE